MWNGVSREPGERRGAVVGHLGLVSVGAEEPGEQRRAARIVVDDEHEGTAMKRGIHGNGGRRGHGFATYAGPPLQGPCLSPDGGRGFSCAQKAARCATLAGARKRCAGREAQARDSRVLQRGPSLAPTVRVMETRFSSKALALVLLSAVALVGGAAACTTAQTPPPSLTQGRGSARLPARCCRRLRRRRGHLRRHRPQLHVEGQGRGDARARQRRGSAARPGRARRPQVTRAVTVTVASTGSR